MIFNVLKLVLTLVPSLLLSFVSGNTPVGRALGYSLNLLEPNAIPDIDDLIKLVRQNPNLYPYFESAMKQYGYDESTSKNILEARKFFLDIRDYVNLFRRLGWNKGQLAKYTDTLGLDYNEIENLLTATEYFPSPNDLVRFAVREVYTKTTRDKFGMDEDIPEEFIKQSYKAGLPDEQARNFWAAHWELPSINMGYEMFHRDIIKRPELDLLMKSLDIMPFWRDKLIQMSYRLPTRVDVRRMYGMDVLKAEDVLDLYTKMGYSPKHAQAMTDFTILYESDETQGLTKSGIVNAYKDDLITYNEMLQNLKEIGYSEKVIDFTVQTAQYEKTVDTVKRIREDLVELYLLGEITIDGIRNKLLSYQLPTTYVDRVINDVILQDAKRRKVPGKEDLISWLASELIDEVYFTGRMRLLGYKDEDIQLYLSEYAIEGDTSKRRYLSETVYQRWLKAGIMSEEDFTSTLLEKGISPSDINNLILEASQ